MIKNGDTCSLSTLELREMQMEVVVLHTDSQLIGYGLLFLGLLVCFICKLAVTNQKSLSVYVLTTSSPSLDLNLLKFITDLHFV